MTDLTRSETNALLEAKAADPNGYTKTLPLVEYQRLVTRHGKATDALRAWANANPDGEFGRLTQSEAAMLCAEYLEGRSIA